MSITAGRFFYLASPDYQSSLIEYKTNGSSTSFWQANTITEDRLFYKNWFHLKENKNIYTTDGSLPEFSKLMAFAGWGFHYAPSTIHILLMNFSNIQTFTMHIYKQLSLIDVVHLDFSQSNQINFQFHIQEPANYTFKYTTQSEEIELLKIQAYFQTSFQTTKPQHLDIPNLTIPKLKEIKKQKEQEELYFSLKDVIPEETRKNINFLHFFPTDEQGIAQLLNTILFLSKKDEIQFIENLFKEDFDFALKIFQKLFPFDLIFFMDDALFTEFFNLLSNTEKQFLKIAIPDKYKTLFQTILTAIPPIETPISDTQLALFKSNMASKARALMQQKFGIKIKIRDYIQTTYQISTPTLSLKKSFKTIIECTENNTTEKSLFFLHNTWSQNNIYGTIIGISKTHIFIQILTNISNLQIIVDEFGLEKENYLEFLDVSKNEIISVPYTKSMIRIILGATIDSNLHELYFDIKIFMHGKNHIFFDDQSSNLKQVPIKMLTETTPSLCYISFLDNKHLTVSSQLIMIDEKEKNIFIDMLHHSGFYIFLINLETQTATFEKSFHPQSCLLKITPPPVLPLPILEISQDSSSNKTQSLFEIYNLLFSDYIQYYSYSTNTLLLAQFLNILFHIYVSGKQTEHKTFLMFYLEKMIRQLQHTTLTKKEKLKILFSLRHFFYNPEPFFVADINYIFDFLQLTTINPENPSLEFVLYKLLFSDLGNKPQKIYEKKIKSQLYKETDFSFLLMELTALHSKDANFVKQFLRKKNIFDELHFFGNFDALMILYSLTSIPFSFTLSVFYLYPESEKPHFPVQKNKTQFSIKITQKENIYTISIETELKTCEVFIFLDKYLVNLEKGRSNPQRYLFDNTLHIPIIKTTTENQKLTFIFLEKFGPPMFYKDEMTL